MINDVDVTPQSGESGESGSRRPGSPQPPASTPSGGRSSKHSKRSTASTSSKSDGQDATGDKSGNSSRVSARPAGYAESPGMTQGSYLNENDRLVVSEPQYTSREKRSLGLNAKNGSQSNSNDDSSSTADGVALSVDTEGGRATSFSLSLTRPEGIPRPSGRPRPSLERNTNSNRNGSSSRNNTPQEQVLKLGIPYGSSPGNWLTNHRHGCTSARKTGLPSPLVDAHGSPFTPDSDGSPPTQSPNTATQRGPSGTFGIASDDAPPVSPRQVASSDVLARKRNVSLGAVGGNAGPHQTDGDGGPPRPHHPASGPPLTSFMRHNLRGAKRGAGGGDPFLTPPPLNALRTPSGLPTEKYGGRHGSKDAYPSPLSAGAASPGYSPSAAGRGTATKYGGMLSSLSPRRRQQPALAHDAIFTGSVRDRDTLGFTHNGGSLEGLLTNNNNNPEDPFRGPRTLTSILELTKRRVSEDASSAAAFQRGEVGGDGTRAFALGGGSGGSYNNNINDVSHSDTNAHTHIFNHSGSHKAMFTGSSSGSPREKLANSKRQKAKGRGALSSSGFPPRQSKKPKKSPFSLDGGGGGSGGSNDSNSNSSPANDVSGPSSPIPPQQQQRRQVVEEEDNDYEDVDDDEDDDFFSDPVFPGQQQQQRSPEEKEKEGEGEEGGPHTALTPPVLSLSPHQPPSSTSTPSYDFKVVLSNGSGSSQPIVLASGSGCVQGMRSTMEDEHFVRLNEVTVRGQTVSLVGILDGHCGRRVATLGKKFLPLYFFQHPALGDNNALAMVESILQTDRDIFHELHKKPKAKVVKGKRKGTGTGGKSSAQGKRGGDEGSRGSAPPLSSSGNDIFNKTRNCERVDDEDDDDASLSANGGGGMVGGGSTLIAAAVHGRMLYVACLGDARAVLLDGRTTIAMSDDHKPQNPRESKRISRCGGFVQFGRVCGVLAVSRALGDFEFKFAAESGNGGGGGGGGGNDAGLPWWADDEGGRGVVASSSPSSPPPSARDGHTGGQRKKSGANSRFCGNRELMVSNLADVKQLSLTDESKFLLLACDGLWDVLSNEEATQFVKDFLTYTPDINDPLAAAGQKPKPSPAVVKRVLDNCCQKLAEFAVDRGSTDNVSVTVLFFHDVVDCVVGFSQKHHGVPKSGGTASSAQQQQQRGLVRSSASSGVSRSSGCHPIALANFASASGVGTGTLKRKKKKKSH